MLSQVKQWICQRAETDTRIRTVRSSGWFHRFSLILILEIKLIKSSLIYLFISISGNIKSDPIPTHIVYSASTTSVIPVKPSSPHFNTNHSVPATQTFKKPSNLYHSKSPIQERKSCSNRKISSHLTPQATNLVDKIESSDFVYGSRVRYLEYVLHGAESNVWSRSYVNKAKKKVDKKWSFCQLVNAISCHYTGRLLVFFVKMKFFQLYFKMQYKYKSFTFWFQCLWIQLLSVILKFDIPKYETTLSKWKCFRASDSISSIANSFWNVKSYIR